MKAISLGAGVQSTTLLHMSAMGALARADVAIFADTGWEPAEVYAHVAQLEATSPIPIVRVQLGNLRADALASRNGKRFASMPLYVRNLDGSKGMARRQCTYQYKIRPIRQWLRRHVAGTRATQRAQLWLGISMDEIHRMKAADVRWVEHVWPLIDQGMTRADCVQWLTDHGLGIPPKSSCIGCPFHGDDYWRDLRDRRPAEWEDAVAFDEAIRSLPRFAGETYLHRRAVPLRTALDRLTTRTERKQNLQGEMFGAECEGVCEW
jgi:hypothetical protein